MASKGHGFGTAPVFLAAISTILGAVLFLRFGYAVAHVGLLQSILIILIGHAITIPTAMALAEIATNLKVEGGGEYYIISRSFGGLIGGAIGISLYMSQAISAAFYMIAFSQAFTPLFDWFQQTTGIIPDARMISIPAAVVLLVVIIKKGADLGVTALWVIASILGVSLLMFFLGKPISEQPSLELFSHLQDGDNFFKVFAIIFPAFTGMTAGVGLSGDLKRPRKSIPLGTLSATFIGMVVYILIALKLTYSGSPEELAQDQLIMSQIAIWGPIIPIGLAAATISSAIGSVLIAPRTLQALAGDAVFPSRGLNTFLKKGTRETNEPVNATLATAIIIFIFVSMGSIDFVAQIISMFFLITYGTLCLISFMEQVAGNPSYRPTFKSKWYISLIGAIACFVMMFRMQPVYATLAMTVMFLIYIGLKKGREEEQDISYVFKGVLFQLTRKLQILIQKRQASVVKTHWRPAFIALSSHSLTDIAPYDLLRWFSHHYGFGSYFHFIKGDLNEENALEAKKVLDLLIKQGVVSEAGVYSDTIISPSFKTAVAQIMQSPSVFGIENNSILFEFLKEDENSISDIIEGAKFSSTLGFSICVLRSSSRHFGYKKSIHIWLTPGDFANANLMILLAYILLGHPEWRGGHIEIFAAFNKADMSKEVSRLNKLIEKGRIPVSRKHVKQLPYKKDIKAFETLVAEHSADNADLVITGFSLKKLEEQKGDYFKRFSDINDVLFVRAGQRIVITE